MSNISFHRIAAWLLEHMIDPNVRYSAAGDFEERFNTIAQERGLLRACLFYWSHILILFPLFLKNQIYWGAQMIKNYFKVAVRTMIKDKLYSFIYISGLAVGIACCLLIILYVQHERSFDRFHKSYDRVFRVIEIQSFEGKSPFHTPVTPGTMAHALIDDYPDIENSTKIFSFNDRFLINDNDKMRINNFLAADSNFLDIFSFQLIEGDPETALTEPYSIILSSSTAKKLFGNIDPMGKTIKDDRNITYNITGIIQPPPDNSHINYEAIVSWASTKNIGFLNRWLTQAVYTYVRLSENVDPYELELKFPDFVQKYMPNRVENYVLYLQPLKDIHLKSGDMLYDFNWKKGDIYKLYIFPFFALFILIIGCINFMNLSTSRSIDRSKEVGLRKIVGATRTQLTKRFLGETLLLAFIASIAGFLLTVLCLPEFNLLIEKDLQLNNILNPSVIISALLITIFAGIISGSYPAFYLSSFQPAQTVKGRIIATKWTNFRKSLVIFQFAISVILIFSTIMIYKQLEFIKQKNLGFNKEHVLILSTAKPELMPKFDSFKSELLMKPEIISASGSSNIMGTSSFPTYKIEPEGYSGTLEWNVPLIAVDYDFIPTLGIKLKSGRNFSRNIPSDRLKGIIINETLASKLGWEDPLNKQVGFDEAGHIDGVVIGVARDFHLKSLHNKIEPVLLYMDPERMWKISIRVRPENLTATINYISKKWSDFDSASPFEYSFLDENFEALYKNDENTEKFISYVMILTVLIACMGLFGLASFSTEKRSKEFGIRKVLGADVSRMLILILKDFIKIIVIANTIALPAAYFLINTWLKNFPYRIEIRLGNFLVTAFITILLTIVTISYQTIRASISNPVDSIRYE